MSGSRTAPKSSTANQTARLITSSPKFRDSSRQGDRGIIVHCFAGCDPAEVLRALHTIRPTRRFEPPAAGVGGEANIARLCDDAGEIAGTLAEACLASRRLPPDLPDLRFHPRCPPGPRPQTQFGPALLVGLRELHRLLAVRRIFLCPPTAG